MPSSHYPLRPHVGRDVLHFLEQSLKSIRYASPGFIELTLLVATAASVGKVVKIFVEAGERLHGLYNGIYKGMQDRKLLRLDVKKKELELSGAELEFVEQSSDRLARMLGFKDLKALQGLTGNPVATLKILLSYYRRVRTLAGFHREGKLSLPSDER